MHGAHRLRELYVLAENTGSVPNTYMAACYQFQGIQHIYIGKILRLKK